jgi:hypothetical protein
VNSVGDKKASRRTLSFAEAEGKIKFPSVLEWGQLDQRVRAALWNSVFPFFDEHIEYDQIFEHSSYCGPLDSMLRREYVQRRHGFVSDFIERYPSKKHCLDDLAAIFRQFDYIELFDFLTFFLRDEECPQDVIVSVAAALDQPWSPYRLILKPPTIVPAISKQQAAIIKHDLSVVFDSSFDGSKTHLQAALDALNKQRPRDVVRESIHAVESAIRDYTGDAAATLSKGLRKLAGRSGAHKALMEAFEKLYAYTSDEKGIRHSLVLAENQNVGFEEALFFLSACSAFVAYLSLKSKAESDPAAAI